MNIEITRSIDRNAWLTALHAKGSADSRLAEQMDEAERLLKETARPKAVYRPVEISTIIKDGDPDNSGKEPAEASLSIKKHLEGCNKAVLMAVTLGVGVDQLLKKTDAEHGQDIQHRFQRWLIQRHTVPQIRCQQNKQWDVIQHLCSGEPGLAKAVFFRQTVLSDKEIQNCGQCDQDRQGHDLGDAEIFRNIITCGREDNIGDDPCHRKPNFTLFI